MTPLLAAAGIAKSFLQKQLFAVEKINIGRGDCVVLSGANGAGKTTLLKILGGLTTPDAMDSFVFDGAPTPPAKCRGRAVYLHQNPYILSTTVLGNVVYGLRLRGLPRARCRALAETGLEWAGILHLANKTVDGLSGGEKQRIALARLKVLRPLLYLLDEPTAHLDGDGRTMVGNLIAQLQNDGATILIATHDNALLKTANKQWTLANGKLITAQGPATG